MPGVIVPRKTVGEIYKLIEEVEDDIEIEVGDQIRFAIGDAVLTSKLIDGPSRITIALFLFGKRQASVGRSEPLPMPSICVSTISTEKSRAIKLSTIEDGMTSY